jgi:hypothetical protein
MTMQMDRPAACAVTMFVDTTLAEIAMACEERVRTTDDFRLAEVLVLDPDLDRVRALTRRNLHAYTIVVAPRGGLTVHGALDLYGAGADVVVRDDPFAVGDAIDGAVRHARRERFRRH